MRVMILATIHMSSRIKRREITPLQSLSSVRDLLAFVKYRFNVPLGLLQALLNTSPTTQSEGGEPQSRRPQSMGGNRPSSSSFRVEINMPGAQRRVIIGGPNSLGADATPRHPTATMGPLPIHECVE